MATIDHARGAQTDVGQARFVPEGKRGAPERVVSFRPRTILQVLGIGLALLLLVTIVLRAQHVLVWMLMALFLAMALNPAVDFFVRRGRRRGTAVAIVFTLALIAIAGLAYLLIPPLVRQIQEFVDAVPGLVQDLTHGRGPLGFLERDYHIVERVREGLRGGAGAAIGLTDPAISIVQGVISGVIGVITVAFLTLFMLLEGPRWVEIGLGLVPERVRPRWRRAGQGIYRTVGGYITGNLLISLIAGLATMAVLLGLGVPYAVPLGILVALLDLIPLAGATIAAIIVSLVALTEGVITMVIVIAFFVVYQQLENHLLQPVIYGRTVRLSPLAVLIAVLIGAELFGILGALAAIPVAGSVQIVVREVREHRAERRGEAAEPV